MFTVPMELLYVIDGIFLSVVSKRKKGMEVKLRMMTGLRRKMV